MNDAWSHANTPQGSAISGHQKDDGRSTSRHSRAHFVSNSDTQRQDRMRADAMLDARHQAKTYVEALGLKLGRVLAVTPVDLHREVQPQVLRRYATASATTTAIPLAAFNQDEHAAVSVTFEILQ